MHQYVLLIFALIQALHHFLATMASPSCHMWSTSGSKCRCLCLFNHTTWIDPQVLQIHCKLPRRLHIYKMLQNAAWTHLPSQTPKHSLRKRPHRHGNSVATTKACKSLRMLNATGGKHSSTPTPARWKREPFANAFWEKPPKPPDIHGRSMVIIWRRVFIGIPNFHETKAGSKALYLYKLLSFALMKVRCTRITVHF